MKHIIQLLGIGIEEFKSILRDVITKALHENQHLFINSEYTNSDCFLTRKEASEFLRISETKLYHLDKEQILPANRLTGTVLYLKSDLLNFFEKSNKTGKTKRTA